MVSLLRCSVEIRISNNTRNISLRKPRIYLDCGQCSHPFLPVVSPGSSGTCHFSSGFPFWAVAGLLLYEAKSFTLAIYFSNPINHSQFSTELGLELSPGKAHLGSLEDTYTRMASGTQSSFDPDIKFSRVVVGRSHGSVQVSSGPVKVTATMSSATHALLEVVLEEERGSREEAGMENLRLESTEKLSLKTHVQEK